MRAGYDAWYSRPCPHCGVAGGEECKPGHGWGSGLIHGQRTEGPRYPYGEPTAENPRYVDLARGELIHVTRVEPVQLDMFGP